MNWRAIARLQGLLLAIYSLSFVPSLGISLWYADGEARHFLAAAVITAVVGLLVWAPVRHDRSELMIRDGFLIVALFWAVLGVVGAIPFRLGLHLDITDSVFEAVSGFTTTGATVIVGLDQLPLSILYHRQQMQWLGGMGVIVLAVAILPLLGVGGMQLFRAEASGIAKEEKLTPRITHTARALWVIYFGLTIVCALAYWLAGMSAFDAISHAYTTLATGGFSTHDASMATFGSLTIEIICIVFMLLGGINYGVHYLAWNQRSAFQYLRDTEVRWYLLLFAAFSLAVAGTLASTSTYSDAGVSLRQASFQVASVITSTGYGTATFADWPLHVPLTLAILSFIGGCAGSTAGGIKVVRVVLLAKMGGRQMFLLAHTNAVAPIRLGRRKVPEQVVYSIWGYYSLYILTSLVLTVAMMAAGLDLESAFGAVTASINLLGPGLGEVASNFVSVGPVVKWLAVFAMLVGRLEVFTLLILFTPAFWRN